MTKEFCVLILYLFTQVLAQTPPKVPLISPNNKIITIPTQPQIPNWDDLGTALQVLKDMPKSKTEKMISLINLLKVISTKQTEAEPMKSVPETQTFNETNFSNKVNSKAVSKIKAESKLKKLKAKQLQTSKKHNQNAPVPMLVPIFKTKREPIRRDNFLQSKPETVDLVRKTPEKYDAMQTIPRPQRTENNEAYFANSIKNNAVESNSIQSQAKQGRIPIKLVTTRTTFNTTAQFKPQNEPNLAQPTSAGVLNPVGLIEGQENVKRKPRTPELILVNSVTRVPNQIQPNQNLIVNYIQERQSIPTKAVQTSTPIIEYKVNPSTKASVASLTDIYKILSKISCVIPKMANNLQNLPFQYSIPRVNVNKVRYNLPVTNTNQANINLLRPLKSAKDVIVFKPKTFSFINCNNNLLKLITMKVLIPLYATKFVQ